MKKYIFIFILILFMTFNVNASNSKCESSELSRLRTYAKQIDFSYELELRTVRDENDEEDIQEAYFTLTVFNLNSEVKVIYDVEDYLTGDYKTLKYDSSGVNTIKDLVGGEKITFQFRGYVNNYCSGELLTSKSITLPYYNYLYESDDCKNYPEFKYCTELFEKYVSDNTFYKELETYKESLKEEEEEKPTVDKLKEFLNKYLLYIIIAVVVVIAIVVIIVVSIKRKKKYEL